MDSPSPEIALLLFTRTPSEEVRYKQLLPAGNYNQQYRIASKMVQNSKEILAATSLPYFIFSSDYQQGNSFGERLYQAFTCIFSLGYSRVIAIGNDCPELKPQNILRAAISLNYKEVIIGPDKAGGIYLLGLTHTAFSRFDSFKAIHWNTVHVFAEAVAHFEKLATIQVLPEILQDLNNFHDFRRALNNKIFKSSFIKFLKRLLQLTKIRLPILNIPFLAFVLLRPLLFRGPPAIA